MAYYEQIQLAETRARFRRNRNPGPGIVQGRSRLDSWQQVLWQPRYDASRHETTFKLGPENKSRLQMLVRTRSGIFLPTHVAMDSISTSGLAQMKRIEYISHFATTSTYDEQITKALKYEAALPVALLDPETDRYHTQGISGLIAPMPRRHIHRPEGDGSYLLVHRPAKLHRGSSRPYHSAPEFDLLDENHFEAGVGVGAHAYEGVGRQPFASPHYAFPLGSSAENTLDMYTDFLGKRRGVNIAVKEVLGASVIDLVAVNASGEPA